MADTILPSIPYDPGPTHGPLTFGAAVCHRTYGSWGGDYGVGKGSRGGISFHFLVGKDDGQWVQFAPVDRLCYHAAGANGDTVGIEVSGKNGDDFTDWQVEKVGEIVQWLNSEHGLPLVYRQSGRIPSETWHGFLAHNAVAGSTHTDYWTPGDWAKVSAGTPAIPPPPPEFSGVAAVCN